MTMVSEKENTLFSGICPSLFQLEKGEKAILIFGIALFEGECCPEHAHYEYGLVLTTREQIEMHVNDAQERENCFNILDKYGVVQYVKTGSCVYKGIGSHIGLVESGFKLMTIANRIKVKFEEFYGPAISDMLFTNCKLSPIYEHTKMSNEIVEMYDIVKQLPSLPYNYTFVQQLNEVSVISKQFVDEFAQVVRAYEIFTR